MFSNAQRLTDRVVKCPYDNHLIARSRIQKHLIKCERRFPENYKIMCPYNATHRFFHHELKEHLLTCPSRNALFSETFPSATRGHGSLNFDLHTDFSGIADDNDECWDYDGCSVSGEKTAETNDAAMNVQKDNSELELEEIDDDFEPLRFPQGYPEVALVEEGSVIEDNESIISFKGIGRGVHLQNNTVLKRFEFGRGKPLTNSNLTDCNDINQKLL